jgi:two-component system response regulator MprA
VAARARSSKAAKPQLFFVVERDANVRRLLQEFLAPLRCKVRFFDEGYAALDAIRSTPPAVVVTDVILPKLDGLALCRLIKRDEALRGVKVVVLTVVDVREQAKASGADAFLDKPIERSRIVQLVTGLLGLPAERASV